MEKRYEDMQRRIVQALCEADAARRPRALATVIATAALNLEVTSGSVGANADWRMDDEGDDIVLHVYETGSSVKMRFHVPDMTVEYAAVHWVHDVL